MGRFLTKEKRMDKYIVLRDLTPRRPPIGLELPGAGPAASGFEPIPDMRIESETATAAEAHEIARDPRERRFDTACPSPTWPSSREACAC